MTEEDYSDYSDYGDYLYDAKDEEEYVMRTKDPEEAEKILRELKTLNDEISYSVALQQIYTKYCEFAKIVLATNVC